MTKILEVVKPFFVLEVGDTLELTVDGKQYSSMYREEFNKADEDDGDIQSTYTSEFKISLDYAKQLIKDGYLKEVNPHKEETKFKNIFDEIDTLIMMYELGLDKIENDPNYPATFAEKHEERTVVTNIVKVLTHLKSLQK